MSRSPNSPARPARAMLRRELRAEAGQLLSATILAAVAAVLATFAAWLMAPLGALLFPASAGSAGSMPFGALAATIPLAGTPAGIALLLAGTYLTKNAAEYAARAFGDASAVRTESRIRTDGWRALWDGAAPYVRPDRQADITHALVSDASEAAVLPRIGPVRIIGDPLTALGYLGTMVWISPALALGLALLVPFGGRLTRRGLRGIARAADERARARAALGARMSELVSLGPVIRAHEAGAWAVAAAAPEDERARAASLAWARRVRAAPQIAESAGALAGAAIIGVGLGEIGAGKITGPAFLTFLTALFLLLPAVKRLATLGGDFRTALAAWDRIAARANPEPAIRVREGGPDAPPSIFLRDVSVRGRDGNPPLRVDMLAIPAGALVAVAGPTGAGKSLLLEVIAGLIVPERGAAVRDPARGRIGYVPQEGWVARGTVGDSVALGRPLEAAEIDAALADAALGIPAGTSLGEGGAPLSGGERQRLALARAFAGDPPLLVLDEPTAALDAATEAAVIASLRARRGRATIVAATHRPALIEAADLVIEMHGGIPYITNEDAHERTMKD